MKYIIGADEVGYGCWAGSLYVAALKVPEDWSLEGLNDSKKLSEKKRLEMNAKLEELIYKKEIGFSITHSTSSEIDTYGLANCLKLCYGAVIAKLYCDESEVILDGTLKASEIKRVMEESGCTFNCDLTKFRTEVKADGKFPAVMGASIMAKTARDENMQVVQHPRYPNYGFNKHVGYGTKEHQDALKKFGACDIHRKSYKPIKEIMSKETWKDIWEK